MSVTTPDYEDQLRNRFFGHRNYDRYTASDHPVVLIAAAVSRGVQRLAGRLTAGFRHLQSRRQTYRQLAALSDHQLKDIGLARGEIDSVANNLADRAAGRR